ncbi:multiple inositol polyphosphate phosphatase 1-like [Colossoma macropomum]|uniref:multiple inositol polyphosphate phosphatase 1-like n=1 Tax=Colossoma macropomum TaxID=42526 RepID=UPI001864DBD1|nr:multiple inositol polyphosphate phosphatase 1-like [Colossoma macropomum]
MVDKLLQTHFVAVLHVVVVVLAVLSSCNVTATPRDKGIPDNAKYFNTKSRYEEVNPYLQDNILAINSSAVKPPAPTCIPVHFTAIIRHGTRFPTSGNIRKIGAFDNLVKTEANGDLSFLPELKAWKMWYTEDMDGRLVAKGRADHRYLAQRLVKTFPSLLTKENLLGGRVKFITSSKNRCVDSTLAFQQGLKEHFGIEGEELEYTENNALMRFYDTCDRLLETVVNNKDAVIQATLFKDGPEMKSVQKNLADLLQIPYANITKDVVKTGFYLCAYEFTILGLNSPWCRLYDRADAEIVEYASDLEMYYEKGYGHDIIGQASCVLFQDLFNRLDTAANQIRAGQPVSEVVTVQIGHSETLLPLLTLLGLFKDNTIPTSTNFASQSKRAFRGGQIMPYLGNLLAALYDCPDGFRLQLRVNEKPVEVPGLSQFSPLFEDVKERYQQQLGWDQETICQINQ